MSCLFVYSSQYKLNNDGLEDGAGLLCGQLQALGVEDSDAEQSRQLKKQTPVHYSCSPTSVSIANNMEEYEEQGNEGYQSHMLYIYM